MKNTWATTWYTLTCDAEQLIEAIGEGGIECFTPNQIRDMHKKSLRLQDRAEIIQEAWKENRTENIWDVAVQLERATNG